MIVIAIEHCNGEIMDNPKVIELEELEKYRKGEYLIYIIDIFNKKIEEIK